MRNKDKMIRKDGTWPANARVDVDYSKGKPKIKFTYPNTGRTPEKDAIRQFTGGPIGFILFLIISIVPFLLGRLVGIETVDLPEQCNVSLDEHYMNTSWYTEIDGVNVTVNRYRTWVQGANFTCDNETYLVKFNTHVSKTGGLEKGFYNKQKITVKGTAYVLLPLFVLILSIVVSLVIIKRLAKYLIKQKWYQKWLPKFQADGLLENRKKKYMKFIPKDVENNIVEIPHFKNVELDYKTEGDFSDKLERIKIREYQYNEYKNGKIGKKKVKIGDWYARFYFKEKPKNGYLEVIFQ